MDQFSFDKLKYYLHVLIHNFFLDPPSDTIDLECQLLEAAKSGDLDTVRRIITSHPHTVNCRDLDGRHSTPLHFVRV